MKIGYPCINRTIGCSANSSFRLKSFSSERFIQTAQNNLQCLEKILAYNVKHQFQFFRLSSEMIPFASHEICTINWQEHFKDRLETLGNYIKNHDIRISMHPDQFIVINSPDENIVKRSIAELSYHADVLDTMKLDLSAKIQIHVGGLYGNRKTALERFIETYNKLPENIQSRLVIENDDRLFSVQDCLEINHQTRIPILFDNFHHSLLNHGETTRDALISCMKTWLKKDGIPKVDFSHQEEGARRGTHASQIKTEVFKKFLSECDGLDFDIMLEIKDKETSALKARLSLS